MALPKKYSLGHQKEFDLVKERGRLYSGPYLGVLVLADRNNGRGSNRESRFGFLVSRKIDIRAVRRNQVKRRLSEAVRCFLPKMKTGFKIIFLPRPAIKERSFLEIKRIVAKLLAEAKLLQ